MSWGDVRFIGVVVALIFIFHGEPDVFDTVRAYVIQSMEAVK